MSRTFRRKNFEFTQGSSWERAGRRRFGFNAQRDSFSVKGKDWWYFHYEWREATTREQQESFLRIHSESKHRNAWSPSRWHRQCRMTENRSINKRELQKWIKNEDYEPLFEADPRNCWWDWD